MEDKIRMSNRIQRNGGKNNIYRGNDWDLPKLIRNKITSWCTISRNKSPSRYIAVKLQNHKNRGFKGARKPSRIHKS